jgi:HD-GYP domain-containing protein (c-di-GMP phosphodiesterase class II)
MTRNWTARPSERLFSLDAKARALAIILSEEFGAPFVFYDAANGQLVLGPEGEEGALSGAEFRAELATRVAREGRTSVFPQGERHLQLVLVLSEPGAAILVAVAVLPRLTAAGTGAGRREEERLEKWAQAVVDRLRLSDQLARQRQGEEEQAARLKQAWEVVLGLDNTVRHLRIHRDSGKARQGLLKAAHGFLGARTLLWVPEQRQEPVLVQGEPCLALDDCRKLSELLTRNVGTASGKPVLWNAEQSGLWSSRFPSVVNLLAFPVSDRAPAGWVIVLNKRLPGEGREATAPFRSVDAATLAPFAALLELQVRSSRRYHDLKDLLVGLTRSLTAALDAKDPYTFGHSERVARIAVELAGELGLSDEERSDVYLAGLLHDVGKIGIRDAVLTKPGPLTAEEFEHIKQHPVIGYKILADLRPLRNLLPGVLYHHERVDGQGYPEGLRGEAIPLLARVLAVADSYDAMSTQRPYRGARTPPQVEQVLREGAATQWDAAVIEAFWRCRQRVHLIRQRGVGESLSAALDGALRTLGGSARLERLVAAPPAAEPCHQEGALTT